MTMTMNDQRLLLLGPLLLALVATAPAAAQQAEGLERLDEQADLLERLRADGKAGEFLTVNPEGGEVSTRTSLGEIVRGVNGEQPASAAHKGAPGVWIAGEIKGLDAPVPMDRSAHLSLNRDTPVTASTRLGIQYMLDWQQALEMNGGSLSRSTLAPYANVDLAPGVTLKGTAGYVLGSTPLTASTVTADEGVLVAGELKAEKQWHGVSLQAGSEVKVVANDEASRTQIRLTPGISYRFESAAGVAVTPHAGLTSKWDDIASDSAVAAGGGLAQINADTELGLSLDLANGLAFDVATPSLDYDRIEDSAISGSVKFKMPLR